MVSDLYRTLHGPYYGKFEVLPQRFKPTTIYLTGVLTPRDSVYEMLDTEETHINESDRGEDDSFIQDQVDNPDNFVTALDSKSRPCSLGISFLVKTKSDTPSFDVCITWARYLWCRKLNNIKEQYAEKGIEFSGPEPKVEKVEKKKDQGIFIPKDDDDDDIGGLLTLFKKKKKEIEAEEDSIDLEDLGAWYRDPRYVILERVKLEPMDGFRHFNNSELEKSKDFFLKKFKMEDEAYRISFRVSEIKSSRKEKVYRITVYFINQKFWSKKGHEQEENDEKKNDNKKPKKEYKGKYIEDFIFHPQIRISLNDGTIKVPYEFDSEVEIDKNINWGTEEYEKYNTKMLYINKRPYARGHMCSAMWKEVDPENECKRSLQELKKTYDDIPDLWKPIDGTEMYKRVILEKIPPFWWQDGEILNDTKLCKKFSVADIRSEYIPIYPISAPNFDWKGGNPPKGGWKFLISEKIAQKCWNVETLEEFFDPFLEGYRSWIDDKINEINTLDLGNYRIIAELNMKMHEKALKRMINGYNILKSNIDARLAFCFANKVINKQYEMVGSLKPFEWRCFQIAFLLMAIRSITQRESTERYALDTSLERDIVDLIWIPTGGGKTEAYFLLAAFTMAYRRRLGIPSDKEEGTHFQLGVNIISRYTLRLLTIQQFRRGLRFITACELIRLDGISDDYDGNGNIGWLPDDIKSLLSLDSQDKRKLLSDYPEFKKFLIDGWLWGGTRFSIGLWIGRKMTPNRLGTQLLRKKDLSYKVIPGAVEKLKVYRETKQGEDRNIIHEGDPSQVIQCPVCSSLLTLPKKLNQLLPSKELKLFLLVKTDTHDLNTVKKNIEDKINDKKIKKIIRNSLIHLVDVHPFSGENYILELNFDFSNKEINPKDLRDCWKQIENKTHYELLAADVLNPGYFILNDPDPKNLCQNKECEYDFEIRCLNPKCLLFNSFFAEKNSIKKKELWTEINPVFVSDKSSKISRGIPIHAYTVDDQIYQRLPTMLISTVDKFAQIAYKDEIGNIFGNAEEYHERHGFAREKVNIYTGTKVVSKKSQGWIKNIGEIPPPEIILQDELHLIEGPLGSYVGVYEMAIDALCLREYVKKGVFIRPKYIASTATIAAGSNQIQALYTRRYNLFPPSGINEKDSFFQCFSDVHPLEESQIGRLYVGLAAPGKSSQTTFSRVYGSFLHSTYLIKKSIEAILPVADQKDKLREIDRFWTIVGYFNTIKELARIRSVCTQDLSEWMDQFYGNDTRKLPLSKNDPVELSSQIDSVLLPIFLKNLENGLISGGNLDGFKTVTNIVLTTSMFGTGVDVSRLGLMSIDGQPKTTGQYIQTSGRIGRSGGGLVLTFLHAGRPRDLDHYEQFIGYHQAIYRYIEPSTVTPFAPNCLETTIGPVSVSLLRQAREILDKIINPGWRGQKTGPNYIAAKNDPLKIEEIMNFLEVVEARHARQPKTHKLVDEIKKQIKESFLLNIKKWHTLVNHGETIVYNQYTSEEIGKEIFSVVLGDPQHQFAEEEGKIKVIFKNSPNSLRGVEPTICIGMFHKKQNVK